MQRRGHLYLLLLLPLAAVLAVFLFWPLALIFWESIHIDGLLSFAHYGSLFVTRLYRQALGTSLMLSFSTAFLGTVIGIPLSYVMYRSRGKTKTFLLALNAVPLTFSGLVVGFAFIVLLGTSGFVTLLAQKFFGVNPLEFSEFLFTWRGLMVAYLYFLIPRMILTMIGAWSTANWSLVEAAVSLGASPWTTLTQVLLPMIGPAVLAGSSLLFAVSMGAFGTAFALTGTGVKILPLVIYTQISDVGVDISRADALAIVLTLVTTLVALAYERSFRHSVVHR